MCSVTFWPNGPTYRLAMNRDEQLTRVKGRPPARFVTNGRAALHPSEPGSGTWISVNDSGVGLALINWYAITQRASAPTVSRGEVVMTMREVSQVEEAAQRLAALPLKQINPFRLIGVFPQHQSVCEWRWNQQQLEKIVHEWSPQQWFSSSYDEPAAQRIRSETFSARCHEPDAGEAVWLRRLHGSHSPERGPFSICMHRADAATVSYTEIEVSGEHTVMSHHVGPLCCVGKFFEEQIALVVR